MSKISGAQALGWWFDPSTGKTTPAGAFLTSDTHGLTPPADGDWVLVRDNAPFKRLPPRSSP